MYRVQLWFEDVIDYLIYKVLINFYSTKLDIMPQACRFGPVEYQDLKYYHEKILGGLKISKTIDLSLNSINHKKLYLLRSVGPYNKGYLALVALTDRFWEYYNFHQILLIAKMYNQFPSLIEGNTKPKIAKNPKSNTWHMITSNRHGVEYQMRMIHCFRLTIAIIGLGKNNNKKDEYGFANYYNFYQTYNIKVKYPELSNQMLNTFDLHCAELERYNYVPTSQHILSGSSAHYLLRIGDVIYSNPLDYSYTNWEGMKRFVKCQITSVIIHKIIDDMLAYNWYSTIDININTLADAIHDFIMIEDEKLTGNLSIDDIKDLSKQVQKDIKYLLSTPKTQQELLTISKLIKNNIVEHNIFSTRVNQNLQTIDPKGRPIKAKRSKFHFNIVLDIKGNDVIIVNIDGGNPLLPMTITTYTNVIREADKVVIFRQA